MKEIISLFGVVAFCLNVPTAFAESKSQCLSIFHNKINNDNEINEKTLVNIYKFADRFKLHGNKKNITNNIGDYFSVPYGDYFYRKFEDHAIMIGHVFKNGQERGAIFIDSNECISALAVSYYISGVWKYMLLINGSRDKEYEYSVRKSFEQEAGMGSHDWDVVFGNTGSGSGDSARN